MRLHGWRQVLYLCHRDCASECSEVPLNSSKDPLSLPGWEVPCYCWSPRRQLRLLAEDDACSVHNRQVARVPHLHATNVYPSNTLAYKKNDIYNKNDIKITYTKKKKLQRWRLTHLPSLLTRRHGYLRISRKIYPCIWVILDHRDLP
jgi:hypothetical protein